MGILKEVFAKPLKGPDGLRADCIRVKPGDRRDYMVDDQGHHHKPAGSPDGGQFTSPGEGSSGKTEQPKHGSRAAALHAKHQELQRARREAFEEVKAEADAANMASGAAFDSLRDASNSVAGVGPVEQAYSELDDLVVSYDQEAPASERFAMLKDIESAAKEALSKNTPGGDLTAEDVAENTKQLGIVIQHARQARQRLKAYVQHRQEMQAIKTGQPVPGSAPEIDERGRLK